MMKSTPKIHFILPAGGVRGAFQAGFLYNLFSNYKDSFEIAKIDGTSVGALNGFAAISNQLDYLSNFWLSINSIEDLFENWSESYLFGSLKCFYHTYYNGGFYSNKKLKSIIEKAAINWENYSEEYRDKYSCVTVCVNTGETNYINGSNSNITDFITASASPWVLSNPVKIENKTYMDGALLETYPIKNINKCGADITVIVGYDQEHIKYLSGDNTNIFSYLANLIDIAKANSTNINDMKNIIKNTDTNNVVAISNPMKLLFSDINKEAIIEGYNSGKEFADTFYKTYLTNK